jgi:hypothetical protein
MMNRLSPSRATGRLLAIIQIIVSSIENLRRTGLQTNLRAEAIPGYAVRGAMAVHRDRDWADSLNIRLRLGNRGRRRRLSGCHR